MSATSQVPFEFPDDPPPDPADRRPSLRVHKAGGNGPDHGTWVLVPPVCSGDVDPYDALRRDCVRLAGSASPSRALLRAVLRPSVTPHRVTFEHLAVRLLDAVHVAAVGAEADADDAAAGGACVASGLDDWLRGRLDDVDEPSDVVAGVLAAAEAAHCQTVGRADVTTALLAVSLLTEVFCRDDERFPWRRLAHTVTDLCARTAPDPAPVGDALRSLVTAHDRRDAAVRCLDDGDGRRAVGHAAAARAAFRHVGCGVDAAGCDVLEAVGLLGWRDVAAGAGPVDGARAAALARLERAQSVFAEFAFDGHAAHCAIVLGAVALDDGRLSDALALSRAAYDGSCRAGAPLRQTALAAELHGDALAAGGDRDGAADWYRRAAAIGAPDSPTEVRTDVRTDPDPAARSGSGSGVRSGGQPDHEAVHERRREPDR